MKTFLAPLLVAIALAIGPVSAAFADSSPTIAPGHEQDAAQFQQWQQQQAGAAHGGATHFEMPVLPRIDGCLAPGGLRKITASDEPGSAQYWCGAPPQCLTVASGQQVGGSGHCDIVQYARREPRYDPNGKPGANAVRDPQDLVCESGLNAGGMPSGGVCPPAPAAPVSTSNPPPPPAPTPTPVVVPPSPSPPTPTCADGSPVPATGICPQRTCPDGSPMPADGWCVVTSPPPPVCPPGTSWDPTRQACVRDKPPVLCPDGSPMPADGACPPTPPQPACPAGTSWDAVLQACLRDKPPPLCPDGSPMPADGSCPPPPSPSPTPCVSGYLFSARFVCADTGQPGDSHAPVQAY